MKINIVSAQGHPSNGKTWSGTAKNIYKVLEANGQLAVAAETCGNGVTKYIKLGLKVVSSVLYRRLSVGSLSWELYRRLNASAAKKITKQSASNHTLHFGTLSLPFQKKPEGQYHYLYTDSTWHLWSAYATDAAQYTKKRRKVIDRLEREAYSQAHHIFSVSEYVKNDLVEHYQISPEKITVVGTGTGVIQPYLEEKSYDNCKILFVAKGRFEDKGGYLVLEAFKEAVKQNPKLHLSVVGQSVYADIFSHPNISTYGFIPIEELQQLFNTHSLFLMPAINEPWGLVYIEAMLCKMPIVGLNRNGFPELSAYGAHGTAIDTPNVESIKNLLLEFFSDLDKMKVMGEGAQKFAVNKFSWEKTASRIIDKIKDYNNS